MFLITSAQSCNMSATLSHLVELFKTINMQTNVALLALFFDLQTTNCTTSLFVNFPNIMVTIPPDVHWCSLVQWLWTSQWSANGCAFKGIPLVVHIADTPSELQLIHRLTTH